MYGYGVDNLEIDSSAIIMVRSLKPEEETEHDHTDLPYRTVRMDCKFGG